MICIICDKRIHPIVSMGASFTVIPMHGECMRNRYFPRGFRFGDFASGNWHCPCGRWVSAGACSRCGFQEPPSELTAGPKGLVVPDVYEPLTSVLQYQATVGGVLCPECGTLRTYHFSMLSRVGVGYERCVCHVCRHRWYIPVEDYQNSVPIPVAVTYVGKEK